MQLLALLLLPKRQQRPRHHHQLHSMSAAWYRHEACRPCARSMHASMRHLEGCKLHGNQYQLLPRQRLTVSASPPVALTTGMVP